MSVISQYSYTLKSIASIVGREAINMKTNNDVHFFPDFLSLDNKSMSVAVKVANQTHLILFDNLKKHLNIVQQNKLEIRSIKMMKIGPKMMARDRMYERDHSTAWV